MRIAIASDHTAIDLRHELIDEIRQLGHHCIDLGPDSTQRIDYPVYGAACANAVARGDAALGIVICGSGVGISLAANKVPGIRCCCCSEPYSAVMSRRHNDANMLALGARVVGTELARLIVRSWLEASYEGGRHARRVEQISQLERDPVALEGRWKEWEGQA